MSTPAQDEFDRLFRDTPLSLGRAEHEADRSGSLSSSEDEAEEQEDGQSSRRNLRSGVHKSDSDDDLEAIQKATDDSMRMRYFLPHKQTDANTGPKGVIADAYAFESAKKAAQQKTFLPSLGGFANGFTPSAPPAQYRGDDAAAADDEDEFMRRWRDARLRELEASFNGGKLGSRRTSPSGRRWGSLTTVDAEGYLDAVEKSARGVTVVVLIYDDAVCSLCHSFSHTLSLSLSLSRSLARSLFCSLQLDADTHACVARSPRYPPSSSPLSAN